LLGALSAGSIVGKEDMLACRCIIDSGALFSAFLALIVVSPVAATAASPVVSPTDAASLTGKTYADWSAQWWQYVLAVPVASNPNLDLTGKHCQVNETAKVFFLNGAPTTEGVTRTCKVSSAHPLFFPVINTECSNVEPPPFFGATDTDRAQCAADIVDGVGMSTLTATIDGTTLSSQDFSALRFASPPFNFQMPARKNYLALPGVTSGRSASDGYWLMLKPLAPGSHTLHFGAAFVSGLGAGFSQNITYQLTAH
jgi:hypothetical protein